jgi:hypothetical protein
MKLQNFLIEDIKKDIYSLLEMQEKEPLTPKANKTKLSHGIRSSLDDRYLPPDHPKEDKNLPTYHPRTAVDLMEQPTKSKWLLLPSLSDTDNKELAKNIRMLRRRSRLVGKKQEDMQQILQTVNQRRREHNYPPFTTKGFLTAIGRIKPTHQLIGKGDYNKDFDWEKHKQDSFLKDVTKTAEHLQNRTKETKSSKFNVGDYVKVKGQTGKFRITDEDNGYFIVTSPSNYIMKVAPNEITPIITAKKKPTKKTTVTFNPEVSRSMSKKELERQWLENPKHRKYYEEILGYKPTMSKKNMIIK